MQITEELFMAILSMDAYNRGYGAGIEDGTPGADGTLDGLGEAGYRIGAATVKDVDLPAGSEAAGFYAVAYDWNGQKVISHRGTDDPLSVDPSNDMLTGWLLGAGVSGASQADLALQFFNAVTQRSASDSTWNQAFDNVDDNILVTGHSLCETHRVFPRSGIRNVERRERPAA